MKKVILLVLSILTSSFVLCQALPRKGFFGAVVGNLNQTEAASLKLPNENGTIVKKIFPGTGAALAGFEVDDVLVAVNNDPVQNTAQFLKLLKAFNGGDRVQIRFYRASKLSTVDVVLQPKPKEHSKTYEAIYSSVIAGENHLRTIITKPKGAGTFPAVLLIGGVGCYSIDNPTHQKLQSTKMWVDSLTNNGFVTMRVEKTGMGDSVGIPCKQCDFTTEKQGYLEGLKQLKSLSYVNEAETFLAGFSMGGVIAPLISQQESVKGIVVYGTIGAKWIDYELENTRRQRILDGYSKSALNKWMTAEKIRLHGLFVEKKTPSQIIAEHPETERVFFEYPMSIKYFQQVADIDIPDVWRNINAKVLAMHGASDFVSSSKEHQQIVYIVNHGTPNTATFTEIENADHWELYTESEKESKRGASKQVNTGAITTTIAWMYDHVNN